MQNTVRNVSLLLALFVTAASAQTAANWTQKSPQTSPSARAYHAMARNTPSAEAYRVAGQPAIAYKGMDCKSSGRGDWSAEGSTPGQTS